MSAHPGRLLLEMTDVQLDAGLLREKYFDSGQKYLGRCPMIAVSRHHTTRNRHPVVSSGSALDAGSHEYGHGHGLTVGLRRPSMHIQAPR